MLPVILTYQNNRLGRNQLFLNCKMHNDTECCAQDINDVFSDILLSEEHINKEGYDEGYAKVISEGSTEGFHLGYHRGAEIGAELGYYLGITETYLILLGNQQNNHQAEKNIKNLKTLQSQICSYPKHNDEGVDILALADNIRTCFKKVCANLKIDPSYPEADKLSF